MTESVIVSIFQITDIAEINSLSLFDFGNSLNTYFKDTNSSTFCHRYFKWFEHSKFDKTNNSHLKDFDNWLYDFF